MRLKQNRTNLRIQNRRLKRAGEAARGAPKLSGLLPEEPSRSGRLVRAVHRGTELRLARSQAQDNDPFYAW